MRVAIAILIAATFAVSQPARGVVTSTTLHGADGNSLDGEILGGDVLSGLIPTELPGDLGWHPANTDPNNHLPIFTDDAGGSGLAGLLNDNAPGVPVKRVQYDLRHAVDVTGINILTGNDGKDGRVFSTTVISASTDGGANFSQIGYFESDPLGTINSGQWGSTLVKIFDDSGADLVTGATNLIFEFYSVDNTGGQYRDPFDGANPFTGIDDGLTAAFVSPLVWEIDVIPEPASAVLVLAASTLIALGHRRR